MKEYNEQRLVNDIRMLAIDMIDNAGSGHPGIVLGAAPILYTIYSKFLKFNPLVGDWYNRDRFVLSAGHGSALLYATLFACGYPYTLDDLKGFRSLNSNTPGHPELNPKLGIEVSTGPLGQGVATAVGIAISEKYTKSIFNEKNHSIIDYKTWCLCGDGDLMEGISYEALSLAGTLKLDNLIILYDSNNISLDGETSLTFTEDVRKRFEAMDFYTLKVNDGENLKELNNVLTKAKKLKGKPIFIEIKTKIGKHSSLEGTNKVHGSPFPKEELESLRKKLSNSSIPFSYDEENMKKFQDYIYNIKSKEYNDWENELSKYELDSEVEKSKKEALNNLINKQKYNVSLENIVDFTNFDLNKNMREINAHIMETIEKVIPTFIGGSADLSSSTKTILPNGGIFSKDKYSGKNIYFGVRENAMGAILNGISLANYKTFGSTFLTFSDYLKPSIRMSALMNLGVTYIFTHDSINIGQDGPTHQPIEQLNALRIIPNLETFRPCDYKELLGVWNIVCASQNPNAIILSRNKTKVIPNSSVELVKYGGYTVSDSENLNLVIIASGHEVGLALEVKEELQKYNVGVRVVSMPNPKLFKSQLLEYQKSVIPDNIPKIAIEYGNDLYMNTLVSKNNIFGINTFGKSGTSTDVIKHFGLDKESIVKRIIG